MTNQNPLLRQILCDPEDVTARLAYADWLDENGGDAEHAELIRLQVSSDPATGRRRGAIVRRLKSRWFAGSAKRMIRSGTAVFDGFCCSVKPDLAFAGGEAVRRLFASHPIEDCGGVEHYLEPRPAVGGSVWYWQADFDHGREDFFSRVFGFHRPQPYRIPPEAFDLLSGGERSGAAVFYHGLADAYEDLVKALINCRRGEVGLPPLRSCRREADRNAATRGRRGRHVISRRRR